MTVQRRGRLQSQKDGAERKKPSVSQVSPNTPNTTWRNASVTLVALVALFFARNWFTDVWSGFDSPALPLNTFLESRRVLHRELSVPDKWSLCDFLARLSRHEPFQIAGAAPKELMGLTPDRLLELAGSDAKVTVQASDNGFIGPNNYDRNIMLEVTMREFVRLLGAHNGEVPPFKNTNISVEATQSVLSEKLRKFVWSVLPSWVAFPAFETRLWIDIPGAPRGTFLHNDAQDNLYFLLNGTKTFQLLPPWQSHLIRYIDTEHEYYTINDHWRWLASKNIAEAHRSWQTFAADSKGAANMSDASRIVVNLQAGDVLLIPRGWWHTTMHDGEGTIAVNLWFYTRHPIQEMWWRSHQDLHQESDSKVRRRHPVVAIQSGTPDGLSKKVKLAHFDRLQAVVKRYAPWLVANFVKQYKEGSEAPLPPASALARKEKGQCIRWSFDDSAKVEAALHEETDLYGVDISSLLEVLSTEDRTAWNIVLRSYVNMMGGTSWQKLPQWRFKIYTFFSKDVPAHPVNMLRFSQAADSLESAAHARISNSHTLLGLIHSCSDVNASSDPMTSVRGTIPHPRCEEVYRAALRVLLGSCHCEVGPCPTKA